MRTVYAKHLPYLNGHLGKVLDEMRLTGAPTVRVMEFNGKLCATEASHRIAAAYQLGLEPKFVIEPEDADSFCVSQFWENVIPTLPEYAFETSWVLDLRELSKV